jgi:hypothetical protein
VEKLFYCSGFGSEAAKTRAKEGIFYAAAGETRPLRREQPFFRCSGGFAARTTEKDSHFHAAAGEKLVAVQLLKYTGAAAGEKPVAASN